VPKGKRTLSPVTRAIQALGMSPRQFVEDKLGIKYPTYQYRVNNGVLRLEDYQRIMFYTGKNFHELWPSEWDQKSQRIPINLNGETNRPSIAATNKVPSPITRSFHYSPPPTTTILAPRLTPTPQESKKKEENFSSPPAPDLPTPYEFGLPPID
jgi:hypothetical protein